MNEVLTQTNKVTIYVAFLLLLSMQMPVKCC